MGEFMLQGNVASFETRPPGAPQDGRVGDGSKKAPHPEEPSLRAFRRTHRRQSSRATGPMSYAVKEIFYTLQGEGALTGRPAVFCRFAGCNLWSGREADRAA